MSPNSVIKTGDECLDEKINEWLQWNKDRKAEDEIQGLIQNGDVKTLMNLFLKRLEFGTAGLRGRMGPGYSQMNDLVIVQTGQGLTKYLLHAIPNATEKGVVIGYDGRYNSKRFAELTAAIFIANNIKVYLFSKVCPTPFIPYSVIKYKCAAGVMVTASHNPKEDNGYKVYWENGAQIIPPHDKQIQQYILENLIPLESSWDTSNVYNSSLYNDPLEDVIQSYLEDLKENVLYPEVNKNTILKFTYTAMHGVGYNYMVAAFKVTNFKPFITVEEQKLPDPEFPTVKFPNPEEGKSALDLSIKTAEKHGSSIILANDPDADRLACAEKIITGKWHIFSGNELGALLGWWMLHTYQVSHPDMNLANAYMLSSTVSSKILLSMAKKEGFNHEETLTGFKWMGNKAIELLKQGKDVLFAYEEAIGFMCGAKVPDKDGISAGVRVAEMAAYLETMGLTLYDKLKEIYAEYGRHICDNSYWICHEQTTIKAIFERLRNYHGKTQTNTILIADKSGNSSRVKYATKVTNKEPKLIITISVKYPTSILGGKYPIIGIRDLTTGYDNRKPDDKASCLFQNRYPTSILGGKYPIIGIRDLTTGYDNTKPDNKAVLPVSKSSQMITFMFKNGLVMTLRTSGTEPKIKYYSELCASPEEQDINILGETLKEMVSAIVTEFLQPELNNLVARST